MNPRYASWPSLLLILQVAAAQAQQPPKPPDAAAIDKAAPKAKKKLRGIDCERGIACPIITRPLPAPPPVNTPTQE